MGRTLLDIVTQDLMVPVNPDSDGGQILGSMNFDGTLGADRSGKAKVDGLTIYPADGGIRVRASTESDAVVLNLPLGEWDFTIVPPTPERASLLVEIVLLAPELKLPFLRPATPAADGTLDEGPAGDVKAIFPKLLLVVVAPNGDTNATAKFAPSHDADGALAVRIEPPHSLLGPGTVLGFGLPGASLDLDAAGGPVLRFAEFMLFVEPPGVPALNMHGGGQNLILEFGLQAGLTGDLVVVAAGGEAAAARPRFIRNISAHLRLERSSLVLLELIGQVELSQEIGRWLGDAIEEAPGDIDYRLALALDSGWQASLALTPGGGRAHLWRSKRGVPHEASLARDTLGAYAVFTPLLAPALPAAGSNGFVDLGLGIGAAAGVAASKTITSQLVTIVGAGMVVAANGAGAPEGVLFFDVETELDLDVHFPGAGSLVKTRRALKVRQKALGLKLDFGPDGGAPALKPVFDTLRGFSLDLADPGTFDVAPPFDQFLQPDAARMARDNPLLFEVDLVTKVDLGVVTIDRMGVRLPLDGGAPSLTALGAHLDLGMLQGGGHLRLLENGFDGGFDVSLAPPVGVRVAASLQLEANDPVSLLVALDAEWPIPIPLAASGVGIYGFLGLLAVNRRRKQDPGQAALDWYVAANGDPAKGAWEAARGGFALGVGAVLGTVEGGFLINAKGMLMIELPGPRLLITLNANLLQVRPSKRGAETGNLLAVIEISEEVFAIGVVADYEIPFLLKVRVPVDTRFMLHAPFDWEFNAGNVEHQQFVSVRFMTAIRADGYLMIHGNGIKSPLHALTGLAVASGIDAALLWGPVEIGLYIKVAASAHVAIGVKPMVMIGQISLEGELHLFVVSIGARALARLQILAGDYYVKLEVEGRVSLFLFEISGSVTLELGNAGLTPPPPEPLLRAVTLHSRTAGLLPGTGGEAVDSSFGEAAPDAAGALPLVPIDAIPVLQFDMRPHVNDGVKFFDQPVQSMLAANDWIPRGERFYRFEVAGVSLTATNAAGQQLEQPLVAGETPLTWWDKKGQAAAPDHSDVQLALLNWIPDPTPAAALRTASRDEAIKHRWGTVCVEAAGEAGVLWTLRGKAAGPSPVGWTLDGIAWPDAPGKVRSAPAPTVLRVSEPWRTGTLADSLIQAGAAQVFVSEAPRKRALASPVTDLTLRPRVEGEPAVARLLAQFPAPAPALSGLSDALRFDTGGMHFIRGLVALMRPLNTGADNQHRLHLRLRPLDAGGQQLGEQFDVGVVPTFFADLPDRWKDFNGPWAPLIEEIYAGLDGINLPWVFAAELPPGTASVMVGLPGARSPNDGPFPLWALYAVEVLTAAEASRRQFDETSRAKWRDVLEGALGADQSKRALLLPDTTYTVSVSYTFSTATANDKGERDDSTVEHSKETTVQSFHFKTDNAPPERLDARVLATAPARNEDGYFHGEPIRIVFASAETRKLFKAYGRDLFAVVRAASGKHPQATPDLPPGEVRLDAAPATVRAIAPLAMTPFEDTVRDTLRDLACVNMEMHDDRHEAVTIQLPLEPATEYTLDVEARPLAAPPRYPLLRRSFRTSRYAGADAFAAQVLAGGARHRYLDDVSALQALAAGPVPDLVLETALRSARWGELGRAREARVTVIWSGAAPAQPAALLVETPERHWRTRDVPEKQTTNGVTAYAIGQQSWLELIGQGDDGVLSHLVRATDGARTLGLLAPGARGKTLRLGLQRTNHPLYEGNGDKAVHPMAEIKLFAPWEA